MEAATKLRWQESLFSLRALRRHAVWILAAAATGAVAALFRYLDDWSVLFSQWLQTVSPWIQPAMLFFGMIVICQLRDRYFQGTDGTGIPQAIASLKIEDGPARDHVLSWRILVGKGLLLAIGLFAGMTIGREGPSVHAGACFMYLSNRWGKFQTWLVQRGLILAGGAAGIAAAFNTPIAGAALGQLTAPFLEFMDPQAVILLCMVSYFAGVVQSPITAFVILVEMTDARFMTMPLALAAMLAFEASRLVCPTALYEGLAENFLTRLQPPKPDETGPTSS